MRRNRRPLVASPFGAPRKRLGQHFLEPAWVTKLIDAAGPHAHDTYVEIGPGRGALTRALAPRVSRLVAVEVDTALAGALPALLPPHVGVVHGDFLKTHMDALLEVAQGLPLRTGGVSADDQLRPPNGRADIEHATRFPPVRVIGNLPYNVSSPILFKLLKDADEGRVIADATVMLQKEVADRLLAPPGTRTYGTLAVQVARVAAVERLLTLPPGAFRPPPKVTSAVVRLVFRPATVDVGDAAIFEKVVRGVFLQRRKTVLNALSPVAAALGRTASEVITRAGVDPALRPEDLSLADFARLSRAVL